MAHASPNGYSQFWDGSRQMPGHRFIYEHCFGAIPDGLVIDHLCRFPLCVNPLHLEVVTQRENVRRGYRYQLDITHCPAGHAYDEANTYIRKGGKRACRTCKRGHLENRSNENKTHCPQGHEYTPGNTYSHRGKRQCRACRRDYQRRLRQSRQQER